MTMDFNNILNILNNPFFSGSQSFSVTPMPFNLFSFGNMPSLQNFDFNSVFASTNNFNFNFDFDFSSFNPVGSQRVTAQEGKCRPRVKLDKAFLNKVKEISARIGCNYKDLLAIMNSESGLNPQAVNKNGGATGLIQFMPSTAKSLGTTTEALKNMTAIQQLDYVEKFLVNAKNKSALKNKTHLSAGDLYALVFLPGRAGREVLTTQGECYYASNKGTDENHDGQITKTDLGNRLMRKRVDESIFA